MFIIIIVSKAKTVCYGNHDKYAEIALPQWCGLKGAFQSVKVTLPSSTRDQFSPAEFQCPVMCLPNIQYVVCMYVCVSVSVFPLCVCLAQGGVGRSIGGMMVV